ncbi:MAG: HPr kinase/phosphorylase [Candidatus Goldbacteria bacterium]|nr:HPr kinase/phosphorylase [Candidatus Goldiibacteriota bacterium]
MNYITVKQFYNENKSKLDLKIIAGEEFLHKKKIIIPDINRPGLALAGFFDYFPYERIQIFGKTEFTYLKKIGKEKSRKVLNKLFDYNICCVIISRNLKPPFNFELLARKRGIPVIVSSIFTTKLISSIMLYLERKLAPKITLHGTFIDVYGIGILLIGKSGIGKSEITLELIKRGHRIISDDIIEVRKMSDDVLEGRGLDIIQHHMEIRGVGIIDIKNLFGVGAVRESQKVELIIHLEEWEKGKNYERLGIEEQSEEMLGVKVPKIILPVKPGRNMSVIIEVAAMTQRLKSQGYNPAKELNKTVLKFMKKDKNDALVK